LSYAPTLAHTGERCIDQAAGVDWSERCCAVTAACEPMIVDA